MQILVIEPERRPEAREIDGSLKSMQEVVGGWIQALYPFDEPVALVCHDEGKLMALPANRGLRDKNGQIYDIVCGTFFLCGASTDSDHFTSLTLEQIERYRELFYIPEMFWGTDGHIVCLPLVEMDNCVQIQHGVQVPDSRIEQKLEATQHHPKFNSERSMRIEIYWQDLTRAKQDEILQVFGENGNWDVFPIATIDAPIENHTNL